MCVPPMLSCSFRPISSQEIEIPPLGTYQQLTIEFWIFPFTVANSQNLLEAVETTPGAVTVGVFNGFITLQLDGKDPIR